MKHWTLEGIEGTTGPLGHGPEAGIIRDLLTERDELQLAVADLRAAAELAKSWRLPDWLGGHAVEIANQDIDMLNSSHVWVQIAGAADNSGVEIPVHWLVEIKPPSIDDPVTLPLDLDEQGDSGRPRRMLTLEIGANDWTTLRMADLISEERVLMSLNVGQLRALACAAWQRANAIEAGA